jgi:lipopolysaccharide/colanic/teichoic acid biosynthesis glycosyltransferase
MLEIFMHRVFVLLLCIVASPILVVLIIVIVVFSGVPVLFRQQRVGKCGMVFTLFKFRTMKVGAEKQQQKLRLKNEANGPVFKIRNDPRFTPIGKWLSHTGLDELPQLYNVIVGDMSLIGPRPLPISEARQLKLWQKERQNIKPGIISPWVLDGYHKKTFNEWMKSDIEYVNHKSFQHDIKLFFSSVWFMVRLIYLECCK